MKKPISQPSAIHRDSLKGPIVLTLIALICTSALAGCTSTEEIPDDTSMPAQTEAQQANHPQAEQLTDTAMADKLQSLVESGDITQAQCDDYIEWMKSQPVPGTDEFDAWMATQPDLGDVVLEPSRQGDRGPGGFPPGNADDIEVRLQELVEGGDITQEQADEYMEWWEANPGPEDSEFETWMAAMPDIGDIEVGPPMAMAGMQQPPMK